MSLPAQAERQSEGMRRALQGRCRRKLHEQRDAIIAEAVRVYFVLMERIAEQHGARPIISPRMGSSGESTLENARITRKSRAWCQRMLGLVRESTDRHERESRELFEYIRRDEMRFREGCANYLA